MNGYTSMSDVIGLCNQTYNTEFALGVIIMVYDENKKQLSRRLMIFFNCYIQFL